MGVTNLLKLYHSTENPKMLSPLTLAFLGDSVYEIMVRNYVISKANISANKLNKLSTSYVNASAQAIVYNHFKEILNEEELNMMKRGRNANTTKAPRRQNPTEYRRATGVECLFGYLYLIGDSNRLDYLFNMAIKIIDESFNCYQ